jgi:hypothetical protein
VKFTITFYCLHQDKPDNQMRKIKGKGGMERAQRELKAMGGVGGDRLNLYEVPTLSDNCVGTSITY